MSTEMQGSAFRYSVPRCQTQNSKATAENGITRMTKTTLKIKDCEHGREAAVALIMGKENAMTAYWE